MQNFNIERMRLGNRLDAGKEPVGVLPTTRKRGFESFAGFVTKQLTTTNKSTTICSTKTFTVAVAPH